MASTVGNVVIVVVGVYITLVRGCLGTDMNARAARGTLFGFYTDIQGETDVRFRQPSIRYQTRAPYNTVVTVFNTIVVASRKQIQSGPMCRWEERDAE